MMHCVQGNSSCTLSHFPRRSRSHPGATFLDHFHTEMQTNRQRSHAAVVAPRQFPRRARAAPDGNIGAQILHGGLESPVMGNYRY